MRQDSFPPLALFFVAILFLPGGVAHSEAYVSKSAARTPSFAREKRSSILAFPEVATPAPTMAGMLVPGGAGKDAFHVHGMSGAPSEIPGDSCASWVYPGRTKNDKAVMPTCPRCWARDLGVPRFIDMRGRRKGLVIRRVR